MFEIILIHYYLIHYTFWFWHIMITLKKYIFLYAHGFEKVRQSYPKVVLPDYVSSANYHLINNLKTSKI